MACRTYRLVGMAIQSVADCFSSQLTGGPLDCCPTAGRLFHDSKGYTKPGTGIGKRTGVASSSSSTHDADGGKKFFRSNLIFCWLGDVGSARTGFVDVICELDVIRLSGKETTGASDCFSPGDIEIY